MPTNRKRISRISINRIPLNLTKEFFEDLLMRDFLADGCGPGRVYDDAPTAEEKLLLREYKKCNCDFHKWQKFRAKAMT